MITGTVIPLLDRLRQVTLLRYALSSIGALAVDLGTFLALLHAGLPAAAASVVGYAVGIAVHWLLSSRAGFTEQVASTGPARARQKALFVASALIGLALTALVVGVLTGSGIDPRAAKLTAIVVSFAVTWLLRQRIVFR